MSIGTHPQRFEGSDAARSLIERIGAFVRDELEPLVREHGVTHESGCDRALLQQVWKRSNALGFYGMTLPAQMGGAGLSILDHVLVKEAIYASGSPLAPHVLGELSGPPRLGALIRSRHITVDVVLVQVSPPDENGHYSLGLVNDYVRTAAGRAALRNAASGVDDAVRVLTWLGMTAVFAALAYMTFIHRWKPDVVNVQLQSKKAAS